MIPDLVKESLPDLQLCLFPPYSCVGSWTAKVTALPLDHALFPLNGGGQDSRTATSPSSTITTMRNITDMATSDQHHFAMKTWQPWMDACPVNWDSAANTVPDTLRWMDGPQTGAVVAYRPTRWCRSSAACVVRTFAARCEDILARQQYSQRGSRPPLDSRSRSLPRHPRDRRWHGAWRRQESHPPPDAPSTHRPVSSSRHMHHASEHCDRHSERQLVRCHASSPVAADVPTSASG